MAFKLIASALKLSHQSLSHHNQNYPQRLPLQLYGRLNLIDPDNKPLNYLWRACEKYLQAYVFRPCRYFLDGPRGPLEYKFKFSDAIYSLASLDDSNRDQKLSEIDGNNDSYSCNNNIRSSGSSSGGSRKLVVATGNNVKIFHHVSGKVEQTFAGHAKAVTCVLILTATTATATTTATSSNNNNNHNNSSGSGSGSGSSGGSRIISGSRDATVRVWSVATGQCERVLLGHTEEVTSMLMRGGRHTRLVTASRDRTIRLWDLTDGLCAMELEGHTAGVLCMALVSEDQLVTGSADRSVRVWDLSLGHCDITLTDYDNYVSSVLVVSSEPTLTRLVSASGSKLKVWTIEQQIKPSEIELMSSVEVNAELTAHAEACEADPRKRVKLCGWLEGHTKTITCVVSLNHNDCIVSGSEDRSVRIWNTRTLQCEQVIDTQTVVSCLHILDNMRIVTGSSSSSGSGMLKIWNANSVCERVTEEPDFGAEFRCDQRAEKVCVHLSQCCSDSDRVLVAYYCSLYVYHLHTGEYECELAGHVKAITAVVVLSGSRDSSGGSDWHAVSCSRDRTMRVWDINTKQCLHIINTNYTVITSAVSLSTDGRVLTAGKGESLIIWNVYTGEYTKLNKNIVSNSWYCMLLLCDNMQVAMGDGNDIGIFHISTFLYTITFKGHTDLIQDMAEVENGTKLVSVSKDCSLRVWCLLTGECEQILSGHLNIDLKIRYPECNTNINRMTVTVLSDGRVVTGGCDKTIRVWNLKKSKCEFLLTGHTSGVVRVVSLSDGRLLSASVDGSMRVWNLSHWPVTPCSNHLLRRCHLHKVASIELCPNHEFIQSTDIMDSVLVWCIETGEKMSWEQYELKTRSALLLTQETAVSLVDVTHHTTVTAAAAAAAVTTTAAASVGNTNNTNVEPCNETIDTDSSTALKQPATLTSATAATALTGQDTDTLKSYGLFDTPPCCSLVTTYIVAYGYADGNVVIFKRNMCVTRTQSQYFIF